MQIILAFIYFVVARPIPRDRQHLTSQLSSLTVPDLCPVSFREIRTRRGGCIMLRTVSDDGSLYAVSSWVGVI